MSVNAALLDRENEHLAECWSCGLGGTGVIPSATQARVVKGVRRHLCDHCAELCDERWQPRNDLHSEGNTGEPR